MNEVTLDYALKFLLMMLQNAAQLQGAIIAKQGEGRPNFTTAEWAVITGGRDAALAKLDADVEAAGR